MELTPTIAFTKRIANFILTTLTSSRKSQYYKIDKKSYRREQVTLKKSEANRKAHDRKIRTRIS